MVSLVETLEPPTIATSGRFGFASALPSASSSAAISGPAHATGAYLAMPCVRGLRAMGRREGVVHIDIAQRRHLARKPSSFFFSPLLKRQFSSNTTLPGSALTPSSQSRFSGTSLPSSSDRRSRDRRQRFLLVELAFGRAAEVRHQQQPRALGQRILDPGQRGPDARVVGDRAVLQRNVEVLANQTRLPARSRSVILRIAMRPG